MNNKPTMNQVAVASLPRACPESALEIVVTMEYGRREEASHAKRTMN